MSSFDKFQSDNAKYSTKESRNNYNPEFNNTVEAKGQQEYNQLRSNLEKYVDFISWARWYPDLFLDLIRPKNGSINLHSDQRMFMRIAMRFLSFYGVFPRGWGKCISGDSILFTEDGMKEIGGYFNYIKSDGDMYFPANVKLLNRNGKLEHTIVGVSSGLRDTKIIKTQEGYEIQSSLKHPLLVMNKNGDIEWKMSAEIQIGDYLLINRNNNIWGNNLKLNFNMDNFLKELKPQSSSKIIKCNTPKILTEELSLVLGYLVGDGTITQDNFIIFTNNDDDILNNFKSFIETNIGLQVRKRTEIDYIVNGQYFREYLNQIGLHKVDAFNKEIPKCILEAPKNIVSAFIKGLFDTDGGISGSYLEFCTASEKMSKQIQTVLLNFGIISTRSMKFNKKYKTDSYIIKIYGKNIDIFFNEIGFSCKRKQDLLIEICNIKRNPNKDILPNQKSIIIKYYNDAKRYNTGLYNKVYHVLKGNNELTYEKLGYLLKLNKASECKRYIELKTLYNQNYFYSKVKSIDNNIEYVYDLSLLDTHSFVSNGFISHNTFNEEIIMFVASVFFSGIEFSLTAQTKENAAELLKDKYNDILKKYPWFKNEIYDAKFSKNDAEIKFINNSRIDVLANSSSSKGQRRNIIMIEESALLDDFTFQDALFPIVEHGRITVGKLGILNPEELSQKVCFFTTAGFRSSDEFDRSIRMKQDMVNLEGKIVLGSDWHLGCWYGRGSTKKQILDKKKNMSPIAFAQNYESKWVGSIDGALVNINKLLNLRTLPKAKIKAEKDEEIFLGIDVARSQDTSNNQSSVAVLEVKRNKNNKINQIMLVNLIHISNALNFTAQAVEIKKIKRDFNARIVIVDTNGLGVGLGDELMKESYDPNTEESLGCWDTINTDVQPEINNSEKCLYDLKPQSANSDIIVAFIDMVESGKLRLLEKKQNTDYDIKDKKNYMENILPFIQTDFLIEEVSNLQLKHLPSGKLSIEKVIRKINKDRVSSLMYGLWYIKTFEDNIYHEEVDDFEYLAQYCMF
jgi:ribonucleoside-diphosphate reductase alpha chain